MNETAQPAESPGIGEAASTSLLQPEDNAHSQSNDAPETDGETRDPGDSVQSTATDARVDELLDLPMTDRPGALWTILSELSNSNLRIRKAAVEAAVQFGSRDAVAALKEALADANDAEEKSEIARAINLLALPSMSEAVPPGADTSR